jgi:hypothetical protein
MRADSKRIMQHINARAQSEARATISFYSTGESSTQIQSFKRGPQSMSDVVRVHNVNMPFLCFQAEQQYVLLYEENFLPTDDIMHGVTPNPHPHPILSLSLNHELFKRNE